MQGIVWLADQLMHLAKPTTFGANIFMCIACLLGIIWEGREGDQDMFLPPPPPPPPSQEDLFLSHVLSRPLCLVLLSY